MRNNLSVKGVSRLIACSILALSATSSPAWSHHGGGTFSVQRCFVFKGVVKQVAWANPHAWLYVEVTKARGGTQLWGFEFGAIGGLARAGFRPSDFAKETPVTVTAFANRNPEKFTASASRVGLPDGRNVGGSEIAGTAPAGNPATAACPAY